MIKILDKSVSELIAAGEVIERPASVIKELLENSIDAGAKSITVEIKNGGITFMRICDDGAGIPHDECPTAFLRHATSKVSSSEDLTAINTLGFRGEALASIAAVSKIHLLTKTADEMGTSYKMEGGVESEYSKTGCSSGTTIIIRDLFYNTPARLKFLKKDVTEGNYVQSVVDKAALINPHIAFRFIRDNKLIRVTPGDGKLYSSIFAVYGKNFAVGMLETDYSYNGIDVKGYISQPLFCRSNRTFQNFYVNSRSIRASTCVAAIEEGYRNNIMTGKFPACVLNISIDPALVDVNAHPAKTDVRFANEKEVFHAVYIAVKNAILNGKVDSPSSNSDDSDKVAEVSVKTTEIAAETAFPALKLNSAKVAYMPPVSNNTADSVTNAPVLTAYKYISPASLVKNRVLPQNKPQNSANENVIFERQYEQIIVLGELFSTYIVCEQGESLVLIDKHAADERIRFNKLKKELQAHSQILIEPIEVFLGSEVCGRLLNAKGELEKIGLKINGDLFDSGDNSKVRVTAMPSIIDNSCVEELLASIAQTLESGGEVKLGGLFIVDEIMHKIACSAAIKAGYKSPEYDIKRLAEYILSDCEPDLQYCPHGRPITYRITKKELEKKFKRLL